MLFSSKKCLFPYLNIFFKQSPERLRDVLTIEFDSQERLKIIFQNKVYFLGLSLKIIFFKCTLSVQKTTVGLSQQRADINTIISSTLRLSFHSLFPCQFIQKHTSVVKYVNIAQGQRIKAETRVEKACKRFAPPISTDNFFDALVYPT